LDRELLRVPYMEELDLEKKRVLVRLDLNVPVDKDGRLLETTRLRAHAPTLRKLVDLGCKVVAMSHQGRPGSSDFVDLSKHAKVLGEVLGMEVKWIDDVMGPAARAAIQELQSGEILLLDNVRFVSEEMLELDPEKHARSFFVQKLYKLFDAYINDAFATAHRSHASIVGFPLLLPSAAGKLMEAEVKALARILEPAARPRVFVLGGAKLDDTLKSIEGLVRNGVADKILATGLVGTLFLAAKGVDVGSENLGVLKKLGADSLIPAARRLLDAGAQVETPVDFVVEKQDGSVAACTLGELKGQIKDIGEETVELFKDHMRGAGVIVMRGPAGVVEDPRFREGTKKLLEAALSQRSAFVVVGGGHLGSMVEEILSRAAVENVHVSTGGGALLFFLAGQRLPALEALRISAKKFLNWA